MGSKDEEGLEKGQEWAVFQTDMVLLNAWKGGMLICLQWAL